MKKTLKYLLYLLTFPLLITFIYSVIAYIFTFFPKEVNSEFLNKDQKIFLLYNEMHSDIVFNIKDFNCSLFPKFKNKKQGYLAFGWGDKETYLNTPTWNDLHIFTALEALFLNTPTLMHVSYIEDIYHYKNIKTIRISSKQKFKLKTSILESFNFKGNQYRGYGRKDFFYTAKGNYNLINTCNTWTGDQLRDINVSMYYWTPFTQSVTTALP
ncbi:MAG: Unknown protein [uncultured Sulfurovum sp.]|uniref:DUF2459 domain-containing protein n=1 Tax=uncultured Sulfurovum sp. TaxID=269237 RepID=A0A6S6TEU3_9BACT|nr:MAG: Unknown protein [uncultured Sulfurovum sp.]